MHPFRKKETTAIRNVNIQIKKGELFGLLGSNGAGKTTLIKILCTLVLPSAGSAFVNGPERMFTPIKTHKYRIMWQLGSVLSIDV